MINSDIFVYPVKPGTEAWKSMKSQQEKLDSCQIPSEVVSELSTEQLLECILNYPLLSIIHAYNRTCDGINYLLNHFDGLAQLLKRDNLGHIFLKQLENDSPIQNKDAGSSEKNNDSRVVENETEIYWKQKNFCAILAHEKVLSRFSKQEEKELGKLLMKRAAANNINGPERDLIVIYISQYLEEQGISISGLEVPILTRTRLEVTPVTVYTAGGTKVNSAFMRGELLSPADIAQSRTYYQTHYPNATILSDATTQYNCHSYGWYRQNPNTNKVWINHPVEYVADSDGYMEVTTTDIKIGDIVYYYDVGNEHSGIVQQVVPQLKIISKWGQQPLMSHFLDDCPYNSTLVRYYRSKYKVGKICFKNKWKRQIDNVIIRHRGGNKANNESVVNLDTVPVDADLKILGNFYYKNGIGASFDYWWIEFLAGGQRFTVKDNFFCNITSADDGNVYIIVDADDNKMKVGFSSSSGDSTKIIT